MAGFRHARLSGEDRPLEILSLRVAPARTARPGLPGARLGHRFATVRICLSAGRRDAAPEAARFSRVVGMKRNPWRRRGSRFPVELLDDLVEEVLLADADDP